MPNQGLVKSKPNPWLTELPTLLKPVYDLRREGILRQAIGDLATGYRLVDRRVTWAAIAYERPGRGVLEGMVIGDIDFQIGGDIETTPGGDVVLDNRGREHIKKLLARRNGILTVIVAGT